jgi:glycosyltransferase involved in cell wall biosynthesis
MRQAAIQERLVPAGKAKVLLNGGHGLDTEGTFNPELLPPGASEEVRDRYGIPRDAAVLGFVGRLVRDKGFIELSQAWQVLRRDFPQLHLLVVGPVEDRDAVPANVIESLKSDPRAHLIGVNWDMPRLYAAMDVVCLPSYREGLPKVPLEAAAMERPVVATRIPGCVDAVQGGVTGALVEPRDPAALEQAIRRYLADRKLAQSHGKAGRARVRRDFALAPMLEAARQEYQRLLELYVPSRSDTTNHGAGAARSSKAA